MASLRHVLSEGILSFPATPFTADMALDTAGLARHVADLAAAKPVALVPAGGAGELFSLTESEHKVIVAATVANASGIPVIAGVGGSVAIAAESARAAAEAGAAAVLLLPPYLIAPDQEGLAAYVSYVCRAAGIGVIVYSRDNGIFAPETVARLAEKHANLIGLKDGTGDFAALKALQHLLGDRIVLINGVPTAEINARQCFALGIRAYSSAVFSFSPAIAKAYYDALVEDAPLAERIMREFYMPLVKLRARRPGYAVSIIKAGLRVVGRNAGPVRPPLVDLDAGEQAELGRLIADAAKFAGMEAAR
ncbi:MAG TPA: 5-dehydro-4-deoxyglucarate dehydratase [Bauldia sp.]|nr:5-dehydro-4-deoxyglucarate dehydratase [Bauldia sp.]